MLKGYYLFDMIKVGYVKLYLNEIFRVWYVVCIVGGCLELEFFELF